MIEFSYQGIKVVATATMVQHDFRDESNRQRTRFDRDLEVMVCFWDFTIANGDLFELAFVKSTLTYFAHAYWKRSNKEGGKIDLAKVLHHKTSYGTHSLYFSAKQKDKRHYLHIMMTLDGTPVGEVYLDGQEVIMLEIAIGKTISLLAPAVIHPSKSCPETVYL